MQMKWLSIPAIAGVLCMVGEYIASPMGSLCRFVWGGCMFVCFGIFSVSAGLLFGRPVRKNGKWDKKFLAGGLLLGVLLLGVGGRNLICVGADAIRGPVAVRLEEGKVSQSVSLRRIFHTYYLEGKIDGEKKKTFYIDREIYNRYMLENDLSLRLICWERSGVIKEIR